MQKKPGDIMNICLDDVTYIEFKILELYNFLKIMKIHNTW